MELEGLAVTFGIESLLQKEGYGMGKGDGSNENEMVCFDERYKGIAKTTVNTVTAAIFNMKVSNLLSLPK